MNLPRLIVLPRLAAGTDLAFLALRASIGAFLVWGVWDNITSAEHMETFVKFLRQFGFPAPEFLAPFDVWAQFAIGVAFHPGPGYPLGRPALRRQLRRRHRHGRPLPGLARLVRLHVPDRHRPGAGDARARALLGGSGAVPPA